MQYAERYNILLLELLLTMSSILSRFKVWGVVGLIAIALWAPVTPAFATPVFHSSLNPSINPMIAALPGFAQIFSGKRPATLGVKDGQLATCPSSPNCVSSQADKADAEHYIEPIAYSGDAAGAIAQLKAVINGMERTQIIEASDDYIYAEFASSLMGFVDDVEFYADAANGVIQVRSASRLGQSDLGVNRKRIDAIRQQFTA